MTAGLGDADGLANGTIVDPGGPCVPAPAVPAPGPRASPSLPPVRRLNPPQMSVQYLSVNPQQTYAGEPVTIITNVVNTGDEAGNYRVALKINGQVEETRMVSVGPQGTQPVKFIVTRSDPGTYRVVIDGQQSSFTVLGSGTGAAASGGLIAIIAAAILLLVTVVALLASRRSA
ncbi:MAG TPA: hypothetical protein EYP71_03145 [Dehalococcoidia bacterium]|nr:hypothetical protein [Dehalococcoidia bacterium]